MKTLEELKREYPELLVRKGYACDMPDGWLQLFGQLCKDIDNAAKRHGVVRGLPEYPVIDQYKEKFSELRAYTSCSHTELHKEIYAFVNKATEQSRLICQGCGSDGVWRNDGGYVRNFCDPCEKAYQKRQRR